MAYRGKLGLLLLAVLSCTGFVCSLPPAVNIYRKSNYPDAEIVSAVATWASTKGFDRIPQNADSERICPDCVFWENAALGLHLSVTGGDHAKHPKAQLWGNSRAAEPLAQDLVAHLSATFEDISVERR